MMKILSGEFFLTCCRRRANSGGIIMLRTLWVSIELYTMAIIVKELCEPTSRFQFDIVAFRESIGDTIHWFGAIFAAAYAALYARFSSQWTYLAGVYNQIKNAEVLIAAQQGDNDNARKEADAAISLWKAGFIEDAEDLHLALKPMFATIIWHWLQSEKVQKAYTETVIGNDRRLKCLLCNLETTLITKKK